LSDESGIAHPFPQPQPPPGSLPSGHRRSVLRGFSALQGSAQIIGDGVRSRAREKGGFEKRRSNLAGTITQMHISSLFLTVSAQPSAVGKTEFLSFSPLVLFTFIL